MAWTIFVGLGISSAYRNLVVRHRRRQPQEISKETHQLQGRIAKKKSLHVSQASRIVWISPAVKAEATGKFGQGKSKGKGLSTEITFKNSDRISATLWDE